ncbi:universal stress protein [Jannaschia donghaensis]|uniref:Stress response protein NhaX n=1 Tax=Jannaschia donghaensis TaxID=420998 RepID=A0A0M6YJ22_9RHOB|nr:universal stress protein [Jannaschia donghaensis]CTQ49503.1 Stress response protein NhaX [Jannaschia donghaensis]
MFKKILATFDGSDHAEKALRVAADMAEKYGGTLEIVYVPEVPTTAIAMGASAIEMPVRGPDFEAHNKAVLDRAEAIAADAGLSASAQTLDGSPAEAILGYATATDADLIVAGRRGLGTLKGLVMGSVSQKLTAHAKCPILTIQ